MRRVGAIWIRPHEDFQFSRMRDLVNLGVLARSNHLRELLQPFEQQRPNFPADDELQRGKRFGGEGRKTPPIHFDQPVVGPARIGGEPGQQHATLRGWRPRRPHPPPDWARL